jgi:hypothetical protein
MAGFVTMLAASAAGLTWCALPTYIPGLGKLTLTACRHHGPPIRAQVVVRLLLHRCRKPEAWRAKSLCLTSTRSLASSRSLPRPASLAPRRLSVSVSRRRSSEPS